MRPVALGRPAGGVLDVTRPDETEVFADARLLIVDDQESNVLLLDRMLRFAGAQDIHWVTDPRDAVERCLELRPDLVLLDLHMPHLDGAAVLSRLRAELDDDVYLPVIVLTADTTEAAKRRALGGGAKDFLTKPLDREEVVLRVRNHLETVALYRRIRERTRELRDELARKDEQVHREAEERARRRANLEALLARGGLHMVFQPIAHLVTGEVIAVEALARFDSTTRRSPLEWFADADALGMSTELEIAAADAALGRLDELPPGIVLTVNVSAEVAMTDAFAECIAGVPGERIVVELTEHVPVSDYGELLHRLTPMRARGVKVAVDDAGAGYAGLQHIVQLRPEVVKLDRDLVLGIEDDPARRAMAASMVHFAAEIDAFLVAEGIETAAAVATLRDLGVRLGQGFHLARPGPLPLPATQVRIRG